MTKIQYDCIIYGRILRDPLVKELVETIDALGVSHKSKATVQNPV